MYELYKIPVICLAEHLELYPVDLDIIYLIQRIEFVLKGKIFIIHLDSCRREMYILRMQSESRIRIIRVRVLPGSRHRRIIDRQELDYALTGLYSPIHHFLQVIELAYSEVIFRPQREYRDCGTCSLPFPAVEMRLDRCLDGETTIRYGNIELPVVAVLPCNRPEGILICYYQFI